jgi:uncharacterized membrane protein
VADETEPIESGAVDRLFFFSDAVVAIAITLLALGLSVPTGQTATALWASVRHHSDEYLAFFISFMVIASAWSKHHRVFNYAKRCDSRLRWLNMIWLLTIILTPFATKLLTSEGHDSLQSHALRYGFYAVLEVVAYLAFLAMVQHMMSRNLAAANTPSALVSGVRWESAGVMVSFGLSIPLFFVFSHAWLLWILGPLLFGQLRRHPRLRPGGIGTAHREA